MSSGMKERLCRSLEKVLHAETRELPAVAGGILLFFLLFLAYSMLRPVREMMGIAGGVQNLQWLFTATFAVSIGIQFLFGWISSKVRRKAILPWTYGFFILNLAVFAALVLACPGNIWTARSFYVWLSVFNLLTVSVAWSVLSDVMKPGQMKQRKQPWGHGGAGGDGRPCRSGRPFVAVPCRRCSSGAGDAGGNVPAPLA